jgi:hypothetical protein
VNMNRELRICLLQSPNLAYDDKVPTEMRIVQLRKSRLFKLVAAGLCVIPLIYIVFLQSSREDIKFSAFSSKNVKMVRLSFNRFRIKVFLTYFIIFYKILCEEPVSRMILCV